MKINSLIAKTALAAAIAGASFAASAGTLTVPTPSVLANEIFGAGSETTSIRLPTVNFTADATLPATVNAQPAAEATFKLTLGGNAVFAENYQDPDQWTSQGVSLQVWDTAAGALIPLAVAVGDADIKDVTGGTAGDNQITITFNTVAAATNLLATTVLNQVEISGLKVQNLKGALERQGTGRQRASVVTAEVRVDPVVGTNFENTNAPAAFVSVDGVQIDRTVTTVTDYATVGGRERIQVASTQLEFTGLTGPAASGDFDPTTAKPDLYLGDFTVVRGQTVVNPALGIAAGTAAGKETGVAFDFTGQDTMTFTLNSDTDFSNYGNLFLTPGAASCGGAYAPATDYRFTVNQNTVTVPTALVNIAAPGAAFSLCGHLGASGVAANKIPEASFSLAMDVDYFNVRYTDSHDDIDYGRVLRNGCQVTLFNVPNVNAADKGFVRLTNTSNLPGEVNAYIWNEAGEQKDVSAQLLDNLDAHATTIFSTDASNANAVYLGDVLPEFAAETSGRGRLVIQGAFPSCEALGLIRSSQGTLTNMTSTTNSSGTTAGTSNTSN